MKSRSAGILTGIVMGGALAGCVTQPAYPLMTPIQVAHVFGYYERPLGGNRFEVSYVTPPVNALGYRFDTRPTEDQSKTMAFDLASLRAAQLAQSSGWQGFDIADRHSSSDAEYNGPYWDGGWGPGWGWGWGWGRHRWWGGGWWGDEGWYEPPQQRIQAEVTLTVAFTNDIKAGDYRAADVIQQVGARYPGVLIPGPTAPQGVPPATAAPPGAGAASANPSAAKPTT